jgi:hypothetical protein
VRAKQQRRKFRLIAFVAADHIADRVHARSHPGVFHPRPDQVSRLPVLRRKENAGEIGLAFGDGSQPINLSDDALAERRADRGRRSHAFGAAFQRAGRAAVAGPVSANGSWIHKSIS